MTLEKIERKIEDDIEEFQSKRTGDRRKKEEKGVKITKKMILESSQCDQLEEVQAVILRDKNLESFENNKEDGFKVEELINIESIYASHNKIKDLYGIAMLTTLVELNLSYN